MSKSSRPIPKRCAIYTRKSSEEGLEQEFNSLDAQRVACEAYVQSQVHEGWNVLPEMYDDGGISGGTMERPALQRLLTDVQNGKVDIVVVYKVDRLTRSLSDFAKIVDVFDAKEVSFVSVTQAFNTTNSMGRLTLNVLLSFAQFEREVTGERIRDKIAASKKKGMWMGGLPSLGYDVKDRKLVVNEGEAQTVHYIYQRYLELGSVADLQAELKSKGIVSKMRSNRHGKKIGGNAFSRGALYLMLQNKIYIGEITHKGESYPGQHAAIIDADLWNNVQTILQQNRVDRKVQSSAKDSSLLTGLIYDEAGERLSPSHANKKGVRYRYYVSRHLIDKHVGDTSKTGWRLSAHQIETLVQDKLIASLTNAQGMHDILEVYAEILDLPQRQGLIEQAAKLAADWPSRSAADQRKDLIELIDKVIVGSDKVQINLNIDGLLKILNQSKFDLCRDDRGSIETLTVKAKLQRTGLQMRLVVEGQTSKSDPDTALIRLLAQAHHYNTLLHTQSGMSIKEHAVNAGVTGSYFTRILRLSYLSPEIQTMILEGRQPLHLTAKALANSFTVFPCWAEQKQALKQFEA